MTEKERVAVEKELREVRQRIRSIGCKLDNSSDSMEIGYLMLQQRRLKGRERQLKLELKGQMVLGL